MAVYTEVGADQAQRLATQLGLGTVLSLDPIAGGIENTNYFVITESGDWVLTLFERLTAEQLPFYLRLMQHLARHGLPVPEPRADAAGRILHEVAGKPAAVVNRLRGEHLEAPDLHHCEQLGATLARMHAAVADFPLDQPNLRGLAWREQTAPQVLAYLEPAQATLLSEEMSFQRHLAESPHYLALPRGAVHADLFRDNAMFDGLPGRERLSGVFDFYFAGVDTFCFDLAVALNDWCVDLESGRLDIARADALVAAYRRAEHTEAAGTEPQDGGWLRLLPALRRSAALRFWLSRLADWHLPRSAALLTPKDPRHFERVLRDCIDNPWHPQP